LTQILTYITGLSGGGLVTVGALTGNNFSTIAELTKAVNFSTDYLAGPNGNQTEYFTTIFENAGAKAEEGFPVSITDIFGQFFGTYLPEAKKFANFSDTALNGTAFSAHDAPMPLVLLAEVVPGLSPEIGGILYPGNNATNGFNLTVWEVSPLYFGNWAGGRAQAFFPTKYLGTNMSEGKPTSDQCFVGFDKLTFIQGSTGTAFNFYFIDGWYNIPLFAKRAISRLLGRQSSGGDIVVPADQEDSPDVILVNQTASNFGTSFSDALWATYPNPFNNLKDVPTMVRIEP
jgi:lysophospholipase